MTDREKLDKLIAQLERNLRSAFIAAMQGVNDNVLIDQLIKHIEAQNVEAAFQALGLSQAAMRPITAAIENAYEAGGVFTGGTFPKYLVTPSGKVVFHFDMRNERAEQWLKTESSTLISRIVEDTRTNVREILVNNIAGGNNPRTTALDIVGRYDAATGHRTGGVIGLTTNQEMWAQSARDKLNRLDSGYLDMELRDKRFDSIVRRAIKDGKSLDRDTVDRLVTRYRDGALKHRGDTIARTETMSSINASDYEASRQAVDMGALPLHAAILEWDSSGDDRVRELHEILNGQRVQLGTPFIAANGHRLLYPCDTSLGATGEDVIDCRCRTRKVFDWLTDLD